MKLKIEKNILLNSLLISANGLCSKTSFPILECFLLEAKDNKLIITSNNTELSIINSINTNIIEEGSVAIEGRFFIEMIKNLPNTEIDINIDENNFCNIKCKKENNDIINAKFQCKDKKDFPKTINYLKNNFIELTEYELKNIIEKTIVTTAKENEERKELTGIYFQINNENLKVSSIDGYKLSIIRQKIDKKEREIKSLIPRNTLENVFKIIKGNINNYVKIYFNEKNIIFIINDITIISNLIQKEFPSTAQMEKNEYKTKIIINRQDFLNSINRTKMFSNTIDEKPVIFDITDNKMIVKINSLIGSIEENINIKKTGEDISIAFFHKNIIPILDILNDEEIKIYLNKNNFPIVIKDDNENYFYLILPVTSR